MAPYRLVFLVESVAADKALREAYSETLGAGTPLFPGTRLSLRLDESATVITRNAAHLFYDVLRP